MILTTEQLQKFVTVVQPAIGFLKDFNPHVKIVVTSTDAEFLEGLAMAEFLLKVRDETQKCSK